MRPAPRRAAEIRAPFDHAGDEALPVGRGDPDIDEAGACDGDVRDVAILPQPFGDHFGKRPRVHAEGLCKNHGGIGRDVPVGAVARRFRIDAREVQLRTLLADDVEGLQHGLDSVFEVGEQVHLRIPRARSGRRTLPATAFTRAA